MKFIIGYCLVICSLITYSNFSGGDKLGDAIARGVSNWQGKFWTHDAYANTTLQTVQSEMAEIKRKHEADILSLKIDRVDDETKHSIAGVEAVLSSIPTVDDCPSAKSLLSRRLTSARKNNSITIKEARRWVDYVRKRYCLQMPTGEEAIGYL